MNVDFALIAEAAHVLRPAIVETPLLESPVLNRIAGARLLVKAEKGVALQVAIAEWVGQLRLPTHLRLAVDIDPQSLL